MKHKEKQIFIHIHLKLVENVFCCYVKKELPVLFFRNRPPVVFVD